IYTKGREVAGYLYPALQIARDRGGVTLSFESEREQASELNRRGVLFLYQLHFREGFKSLKKYCHTALSGPSALWLSSLSGGRKGAADLLLHFIMRSIFSTDLENIPEKDAFFSEVERVKQQGLYRRGQEICEQLLLLLRKRREVSEHISRFSQLARQSHAHDTERYEEYERLLTEILPPDFLEKNTLEALGDCPRFFQGLMVRIERAHANPAKDLNKAKQLEPCLQRLASIPKDLSPLPPECRKEIIRYQEMVKEFRLALFAPEIKGGRAVSAKKLRSQWQQLQSLCPGI
ncbi:MAG: DUF3418 domain-containing protein, partial [Thermodesulfobacteriota bacterium]